MHTDLPPSEPDASPDEPDPPEPGVEVDVAVDLPAADREGLVAEMQRVLRGACEMLGESRARLGVVIIDDEQMTTLHDQFMQIPETTDVLTFDLRAEADEPVEGELYLCHDEARRRAAQLAHPVEKELLLYAVHGLLHLVGYDDHDPEQWKRMHAEEDRLLERLGVGRVFEAEGGGESG